MFNKLKKKTWTSVDERLPEENLEVLICNKYGELDLGFGMYDVNAGKDVFIWFTSKNRFGDVVAWQYLPGSYVKE